MTAARQSLNPSGPLSFLSFPGRRLCLGEALAKAELFLFLAHVMHRYQVAPESPDSLPTFDSVLGISMAPAAHNIRLVRRDGAMDHSDDHDK